MRTQRRRLSVSDFRHTPLAAALGAALASLASTAAGATTITVTSAADGFTYGGPPPYTLGDAINYFNTPGNCSGVPGVDVINFFSNGPFVSNVSTPLPTIQCDGLTIDGIGHGSSTTGMPQLVGNGTLPVALQSVTAVPVTINGMDISGFQSSRATYGGVFGTAISGNVVATNNVIHGNDTGIHLTTGATAQGNRVFSNGTGIETAYGGSGIAIQGNDVYNNSAYGITAGGAPDGAITLNVVGFDDGTRGDLAGIADNVNAGNGIGVYAFLSSVDIGQNTISSNDTGVILSSDRGSHVRTNNIGTDAGGTNLAANITGIVVGSSDGTFITNNVVAGADTAISLDFSSNIQITGNFIGTDRTAAATNLLNFDGVVASCGSGVVVGGNVIASNGGDGIDFFNMTGGGKVNITDNRIGVRGDGVTPLGNNSYGVRLASSNCAAALLVAKSTAPLGATDGIVVTQNVIAHSMADGILLSGAINTSITHNTIVSNAGYGVDLSSFVATFGNQIVDNDAIYGNATGASFAYGGAKNINLGFSGGSLPNDAGDADSTDVNFVPNNGQNYPLIDSAVRDNNTPTTHVAFTLEAAASAAGYRIDVYGNSPATTVPGGNQLLGTLSPLMAPAAGPVSGNIDIPGVTADSLSLLATNLDTNETSEFSPVANAVSFPAVSVAPSVLDFGSVVTGTNSSALTSNISSTGLAPYQISAIGDTTCSGGAICASGAFTCTTTCNTTPYATGASCQVTATFHPTTVGPFSKTIAICDNVAPNSRTITLTGSGVAPPTNTIVISPSSYDFGTALLGTHSASTDFILFNPGSAAVGIGALLTTADFVLDSTTCGTTIAATDRCHASVSFAPTRVGAITGSLSVATGPALTAFSAKGARFTKVTGATASAALSGTGTVQAVLDVPSAIDFGDYTAGTPAVRRSLTLRNNGNAVLTFGGISVNGPFTLGNGCPENLQPGESCTLTLDFSQAVLGPYGGTLTVQSNAAGGSRTIALSARTVAVAAPRITVSPVSIGFGDRLLTTQGPSQRVTIKNEGNDAATLSAPTTSKPDFVVVGTTCGLTLAPAQTCFADVAFQPAAFGARAGELLIGSNSANSPARVTLNGNGCRPFSSSSSRLGASFGCSQ